MKDHEKDKMLIARFFDFALSEEELIVFEKRISTDATFNQKVKAYKEADKLISDKYPFDKKQERSKEWKKISDTHVSPKESNKINYKWIGAIAAGLVLFFSIWQINSILQEPNMEQLITDSWNKNVGLGYYTDRSDMQSPKQQKIVETYLAYKDKNYNKVIRLVEGFKEGDTYFEDVVLMKALATHKLGDSKNSLALLNTLTKNKTSTITKTANWYKGLIYLDLGDTVSAAKFLELPKDDTSSIKLKK